MSISPYKLESKEEVDRYLSAAQSNDPCLKSPDLAATANNSIDTIELRNYFIERIEELRNNAH